MSKTESDLIVVIVHVEHDSGVFLTMGPIIGESNSTRTKLSDINWFEQSLCDCGNELIWGDGYEPQEDGAYLLVGKMVSLLAGSYEYEEWDDHFEIHYMEKVTDNFVKAMGDSRCTD